MTLMVNVSHGVQWHRVIPRARPGRSRDIALLPARPQTMDKLIADAEADALSKENIGRFTTFVDIFCKVDDRTGSRRSLAMAE